MRGVHVVKRGVRLVVPLINDATNLDEPFRWISRKRGSAAPSRPWLCVKHEPGQRSDWHGQIHKLTAKKKTTERSFTD